MMQPFELTQDTGFSVVPSQGDTFLFQPPDLAVGGDNAKPGILESSLGTTVFGQVGDPAAFLRAVFCGHPDPKGLQSGKGEFVWNGKIFDKKATADKPGWFFAVTPYPIYLADNAGTYGKGLGDGNVGTPCVLCCETDENPDGSKVPLEVQARRLDALVALGLPQPNAVCLSGGKSLHAFWAVAGMDWATREALQGRLLALLGADPVVGTRGRKMRLGGVKDALRTQTILLLRYAPTTPDAMLAGLMAGCTAWGMDGDPADILAARLAQKSGKNPKPPKVAGATTAPKTGKPQVGQTIGEDVQIESVNHGTGTLAELTHGLAGQRPITVFCPFHDHDGTHNATAGMTAAKTPWLHCFGDCGGQTYYLPRIAPSVFKNVTQPTVVNGITIVTCNHRYLPKLSGFKAGVNFVKSPRDTGKTTTILSGFRAELEHHADRRAIIIVHRRALVAKYLHDLAGLGFVGMPDKGPIVGDRVVVCLDSLPRVPIYNPVHGVEYEGDLPLLPWHIAFIDESEQVFCHLDADSLKKNTAPERVVWTLAEVFKASRTVVFADADLGNLTIGAAKLLGLDRGTLTHNTAQPDRAARIWPYQDAIEKKLMTDWASGHRVAVACTTRADATRIATKLGEASPTRKVICVTADTSAQYVDLICDPDGWILTNQPDALVYSPSLGTGVDISIRDYWDSVFVVADVGNWTDLFSILQSAERVRNPRVRERHFWVRPSTLWGETDLTKLRQAYVQTPWGELQTAKSWGRLPTGVFRTTVCDTTREVLIRTRAHLAAARGSIKPDLVHYLVAAGWALTVEQADEDEAARKQILAERKAIKDAWIGMIVTATPMDLTTAHLTLRTAADQASRACALSAVLRDKLGLTVLDHRTVRDWLFGGLSKKIRVYSLLRCYMENRDEPVSESVSWTVGNLTQTSSVRPYLTLVDKILKITGPSPVPPKMDMVNNLTTLILGGTAGMSPQDEGDALSEAGIKVIRKSVKVSGQTNHVRTVDPASVERMDMLSRRWLERRGVRPDDGMDDLIVSLLNS